MNLIIWVYLALGIWPSVSAVYYLQNKEEFLPPKDRHRRNNSYFGYSITYDAVNKALIISSPRENYIGEVYTCSIENRTCTPMNAQNIVERISSNYTHDYWFGATVKAGLGSVTICAPRFTALFKPVTGNWYNSKMVARKAQPSDHVKSRPAVSNTTNKNLGNSSYTTNGMCYSYTARSGLRKRNQISDDDRIRDLKSDFKNEETMDSFGWSIEVTSKDSTIVGGPGMTHGRAMIYVQSESHNIPKLCKIGITKSSPAPEYNFGYAIASGMFINNALSIAISSPYGTRGKGKILFYKDVNFQTKYIEDTSHIGSMFGAVLCAAELLRNRTDLLVGAPAYATKDTYNLGAVYVYLSLKLYKVPELHRRIVGKVSGSMFGSAIINVGDLNGDERDEVAIGAPFEKDGHGVVYIYSGAELISKKIERDLIYLQKIEAGEHYGESFGMSLSPLLDYDKNGCKELAIGSPYKDTVVLLRCIAAIIVETSNPKCHNLQISNSSETDFKFEVCLTVRKYPTILQKINAVLSTTVEIVHGVAKQLHTNGIILSKYETSLDEKKLKYCKNISLSLSEDGEYRKISYNISTKLLNNPATLADYNISRVMLSDLSVLTKHDAIWAEECAANKTYVPILTFTPHISFDHDDERYIIGSSKNETVSITVHNVGDVAFNPCVRVRIVGVNVLTTPALCVHENLTDQNSLVCKSPKPIRTDTNWTTDEIVLEMTNLTNLDRNILFDMFLFDHCDQVSTKNISNIILVKADPRGIGAKGETDIGSIVNVTKEDIEKNGKKMQHIYTITNKGPTNWKKLEVLVNLQRKPYLNYSETPVTVYYSTLDSSSACQFLEENETLTSYKCLIETLVKKVEIAKILILMHIVPGTLDGVLKEDKNVEFMSFIKLKLIADESKEESIITTIKLQEPKVPIETILKSVVVGLCIIIITSLILYRVGFLRRKKREELNKLKMKVKRQTILRHSIMPPPAPQDEFRTTILETMEEENKNDLMT